MTVRLANASLLKRILVFWNFSAFIPICSKCRLQNSPYFRLFKYARAVKQKVWNEAKNRERDWGETLRASEARAVCAHKTPKPRVTNFFTDFEEKTDCFAVYSKWQISVYFTGVAPLETAPKFERRKKNSPSYSKRRIRKFHVAACRDVTEMYQKACKIYCLTWNLLLFDVFLVAVAPLSLPKPPSFIDVCKLLGVRMWMFLVLTLATWSE